MKRSLVGLVLCMVALGACGGDISTPFSPGLAPLEAVTVAAPAATAADAHPEALTALRGESPDYEWVQARAYVHAPLARVYEALRDPEVVTDRRRVSTWTARRGTEPMYPFSFVVHNVVHDIITIEFDVAWRLGPIEGTESTPTRVGARYQKTEGSSYIERMEGSVVVVAVDDHTSELQFVRRINSSGSGAADAEQYIRDCYASVLARVRGEPLPTFR